MSMTYEEAQFEEWMDKLYAEHSQQAIEEFTIERLQSFYLKNPKLAEAPLSALDGARVLLRTNPSASLIFAVIAIEVGLKVVLLKPLVYGLVHSESVASLITELTIGHTGIDRFRQLLFQILAEHRGIDLENFKRDGYQKTLWEEITEVQKRRNAIIHRADSATSDNAKQAIEVGSIILETLFPTMVKKLGLHLHERVWICNDWRCK